MRIYHREEAYRFYVTDSLYAAGHNKALIKRFYEILHPAVEDERSASEIVAAVIKSAGIKLGKEEE